MQSLQIRFARTQVSRFCRVSTKKTERQSVRQRVAEIRKYNGARTGINNDYGDDEEQSDDQSYQTTNNGITQDQANMMLTQLTALRGVLANGGNVHECQAALIAVTDELKRLLMPPEQTQETGQSGAV